MKRNLPTGLWRTGESILFYCLGLLIREFQLEKSFRNTRLLIIGFVLSCLLWGNKLSGCGDWSWFLLASAEILSYVYVMNYLSNDVIEYVGKNTMPIYLLHIFFIVAGRVLFTKLGISQYEAVYVLVLTIISLSLPMILYRFVVQRVIFLDFVFEPKKYIVHYLQRKKK